MSVGIMKYVFKLNQTSSNNHNNSNLYCYKINDDGCTKENVTSIFLYNFFDVPENR